MRRAAAAGLALLLVLAALAAIVWQVAAPAGPPVKLRFSAGSPAGEYYDFAAALADLARFRESHLEIEVLESDGAQANAAAVADGTAELGLVQGDTVVAPSLRAIAGVFPEVLHLVASEAAGIASPADLGGRRIGLMPEGSGSNALFFRVMQHYGYEEADLDVRFLTPDAAMAALRAGEVDAMARVIALGNAGMRDLLRTEGLALVPLDQAQAIQMFAPARERLVIPRGALNGRPAVPPEDIEALGVRAVLVADAGVANAVVRELTELLFESRNRLRELDEHTALLADGAAVAALGFPIHPGAQSYFDADKPLFLVRYADAMALGLSAAVIAASALWQLTRWLDARRKNRGDAYIGALARAIDDLRGASTAGQVAAIEGELYRIFHQAIDDIDHDRLAPETLPTFDLVWRSAADLLAHRRSELRAEPMSPAASGRALERESRQAGVANVS